MIKVWAVATVPGSEPANIAHGCQQVEERGFTVFSIIPTMVMPSALSQAAPLPVYAIVAWKVEEAESEAPIASTTGE